MKKMLAILAVALLANAVQAEQVTSAQTVTKGMTDYQYDEARMDEAQKRRVNRAFVQWMAYAVEGAAVFRKAIEPLVAKFERGEATKETEEEITALDGAFRDFIFKFYKPYAHDLDGHFVYLRTRENSNMLDYGYGIIPPGREGASAEELRRAFPGASYPTSPLHWFDDLDLDSHPYKDWIEKYPYIKDVARRAEEHARQQAKEIAADWN
jgi:hypothetical protein